MPCCSTSGSYSLYPFSGTSTGPDQSIFKIKANTWLNLRTGVVAGLNTTQFSGNAAVYTFNSSMDGQVARQLIRADATVFSPVRLASVLGCCQHMACLLLVSKLQYVWISTPVSPTRTSIHQLVHFAGF